MNFAETQRRFPDGVAARLYQDMRRCMWGCVLPIFCYISFIPHAEKGDWMLIVFWVVLALSLPLEWANRYAYIISKIRYAGSYIAA